MGPSDRKSNRLFQNLVYLFGLKQLATIAFTVIYLFASSGILVGQHLCMDRVKETALFKKVESKCGLSQEMHQQMADCCDDIWSLQKVEDDQQASTVFDSPEANYQLLYEVPFQELVSLLNIEETEVEVKNTGPPDIAAPDLFLRYCSLKIPSDLQS